MKPMSPEPFKLQTQAQNISANLHEPDLVDVVVEDYKVCGPGLKIVKHHVGPDIIFASSLLNISN